MTFDAAAWAIVLGIVSGVIANLISGRIYRQLGWPTPPGGRWSWWTLFVTLYVVAAFSAALFRWCTQMELRMAMVVAMALLAEGGTIAATRWYGMRSTAESHRGGPRDREPRRYSVRWRFRRGRHAPVYQSARERLQVRPAWPRAHLIVAVALVVALLVVDHWFPRGVCFTCPAAVNDRTVLEGLTIGNDAPCVVMRTRNASAWTVCGRAELGQDGEWHSWCNFDHANGDEVYEVLAFTMADRCPYAPGYTTDVPPGSRRSRTCLTVGR